MDTTLFIEVTSIFLFFYFSILAIIEELFIDNTSFLKGKQAH
ncbi:hypothetical protein IGK67_001445 [Enterococcus sp. AZ093]